MHTPLVALGASPLGAGLRAALLLGVLSLAACWPGASEARAAQTNFNPGQVWRASNSQPIQAHGGGIIYRQGTYYWHGELKASASQLKAGYRFLGVACYSSSDLYNWTYRGVVLPPVNSPASHDLHTSKICEGPKVLYNDKTAKYVMWFHVDTAGYGLAKAGVALSSSPLGPFIYQGSLYPDDEPSRDMTLFKDQDGSAYLVFDAGAHTHLHFARLSDDYLRPSGQFTNAFQSAGPPEARESPVLFKAQGKYFIITSGTTSWTANAAQLAVADSVFGPWQVLGNPCVGAGAEQTFSSQGAHVLPIESRPGAFLFMADRWNADAPSDSRYVWLPMLPVDGGFQISWLDRWDLSWFDQHGFDSRAPVVRFSAPAPGARSTNALCTVSGRASDNVGVAAVFFQLNSEPWQTASGTTNWSASLTLNPGSNWVRACAVDAAGNRSATNSLSLFFNPFASAKGWFQGLWSTPERAQQRSGFVRLYIDGQGGYSAGLLLGERSLSQSGRLDLSGHASAPLAGASSGGWRLELNLDLAAVDQLSGSVSGPGWQASLEAQRQGFDGIREKAAFAGKYTLLFTSPAESGQPQGYGFASVGVDPAGAISFSGELADGTPLKQYRAVAATREGRWPLYAPLYQGQGSLWGWLSLDSDQPSAPMQGQLSWLKPSLPASHSYAAGFTNLTVASGSPYTLVAARRVLQLTNASMVFEGGNLAQPFTHRVALNSKNQLLNAESNYFSAVITLGSGTFSGQVRPPGSSRLLAFRGGLFQSSGCGLGHFLGTNQSGSVSLTP